MADEPLTRENNEAVCRCRLWKYSLYNGTFRRLLIEDTYMVYSVYLSIKISCLYFSICVVYYRVSMLP